MRLSAALEEKKMDLRLRDKLIGDGKLTTAALKDFVAKLPDDSARAILPEEERQKKDE